MEINYCECCKKHNHAHFLLAHLLFVCLSQEIKDLWENILLTMTPLAFLWSIKANWNKCCFNRQCCRSHTGEPAGTPSSELWAPPLHHILHWTRLPYQQRDLKAVQDDTTSAFWRTIKRCQTWFLLHCFGLGCQRIKHYLKEGLFRRVRGPCRFTDSDEGTQSPWGMWVGKGHKSKREHDKKKRDGGGCRGGLQLPCLALSWEPGG